MSKEEVEIQFTDPYYSQKFGRKPMKMPLSVAAKYEKRGWARIITTPPEANPSPEKKPESAVRVEFPKEVDPKEPFKPEPKTVPYMEEDNLLDRVFWATSTGIPGDVISVARDSGFIIDPVNPNTMKIGDILLGSILVVGSDLSSFSEDQKSRIRSVMFQKKFPFVFWVESPPDERDRKWVIQCFMSAGYVVFSKEETYEQYLDSYGDSVLNLPIYKNAHEFWKNVNHALEKKL